MLFDYEFVLLFRLEVVILHELLSAQIAISDLMFLESLLSLNRAKDNLDKLGKLLNSKVSVLSVSLICFRNNVKCNFNKILPIKYQFYNDT